MREGPSVLKSRGCPAFQDNSFRDGIIPGMEKASSASGILAPGNNNAWQVRAQENRLQQFKQLIQDDPPPGGRDLFCRSHAKPRTGRRRPHAGGGIVPGFPRGARAGREWFQQRRLGGGPHFGQPRPSDYPHAGTSAAPARTETAGDHGNSTAEFLTPLQAAPDTAFNISS